MRRYLLLLLLISQSSFAVDCVVLLHGLGRTSMSMNSLERSLHKEGYIVVNDSYPSTEADINTLSAIVGDGIAQCREANARNIHFVTHSLGGILVRKYFQNNVVPQARRVVMLGPPNRGSEVTSLHRDQWWFKLMTGPVGQELGVEPTSTPNQLKRIPLEVGIIAGTESLDPWFSPIIPGPHDGKVSVESTRLEEMTDFVTVPHSHTFMTEASEVYEYVSAFLARGRFHLASE
jgi:triacylglycerol lipase